MSRLCKFLTFLLIIGFCQQLFICPACAKKRTVNTPYQEYLYQQKVLRKLEKERYKRSLLPQSGYMTKEEYESQSKDVPISSASIPEPKLPKDIKMKYVPQPVFKLARYNDPPGTVELQMGRKLHFDRQENGLGIASPDLSIMVYPAVYYYAESKSTACDLFVIQLDKSLPDVDRILRANVVKRNPEPILSTSKNTDIDFAFKTLTPVDFSADGLRLIAKEKIGYTYDGIWQTNLWVYDFETKTAKNLVEVRDAIKYYWLGAEGIRLDEKRWDIFPLGFDAGDPNRIIVTAYAYTGQIPKFLGTWSVDYKGERSMLVSLFNANVEVGMNGFRLVQSGVVNPSVIKSAEKKENKVIKKKRKAEKKAKKHEKKLLKHAYKQKIKEMKSEERQMVRLYKQKQRVSAPTALE